MNKHSRPKIGEVSHELFTFTKITWNVLRVHILSNNVNYSIESPSFFFAGAFWILHAWPYGHTDSEGWIDLGIQRLKSTIPEHCVNCKFYFKTNRGKEFEPYQDSFIFNENCNTDFMMFTEKKSFFRNEKAIIKDGILTIVCEMRTPKVKGIEEFSQTDTTADTLEDTTAILLNEKPKQEAESSATSCKVCNQVPLQPVVLVSNKMCVDFKELLLNKEDCDVVLKVKGQEFLAHKIILRSRSPVFAATFRNDMKEKASGVVDIEDCDPSSFPDFLHFLYSGSMENLTRENVFSLFFTADKYDVGDLRWQCKEFMKRNLSVDTFCDTITLALKHFDKELIEFANDFFAKNFQEIIVTVKWQSFIVKNPIQGNEILVKALVPKKK